MSAKDRLNRWMEQARDGKSRHRGEGFAEMLEACAAEGLALLEEREEALDLLEVAMKEDGGENGDEDE